MIVVASPSSARVHKGLRAQKQKKASTGSRTPYLPAKSAWPFPLHHDTLHVHPSLKMQLYNPLTIVPSSGPLSLWPSHSFWDPNLIKKCPPVPTIIAWTRIHHTFFSQTAVRPPKCILWARTCSATRSVNLRLIKFTETALGYRTVPSRFPHG